MLERAPLLADSVVTEVRDRIRTRRLVPGPTYSVYQLADELGVSRSPVREGLVKLAEAGVVRFRRNRGFQVLLPEPRDIAEIFAVRVALEVPAARRAAGHASDDAVAAIAECMAELEATTDPATFWERDRTLHRLVLLASGNRRAAATVDELRAITSLLDAPTDRTRAAVCAEHRPIVDALVARDGTAAAEAMRSHLSSTALLLMARAAHTTPDDPALTALWAELNAEDGR
ncbi:GntR family transcriptional regulator [Cryptosporangium japonicum]|uniref:GntR family transcriptional regulator n=1 Tax=Cryptosporangium japonicum TaxID=80872 RepID=A0ABN0U6W5_9ACTN